jgi:hypothetical protein
MSWPTSQAWELGSEQSWWRSAGPGSIVLAPSVVRDLAGEQGSGEDPPWAWLRAGPFVASDAFLKI